MGVVPAFRTTTSTLFVEPGIPLVAKEDKERRQVQFRSKSMPWKEPSKWTRFWRNLRFDGAGKKVHAARPERLNYDAKSYAMNFEKDRETATTTAQPMPKISGPGARDIVTVLLQRSSSTNRNSGWILIPKAIPDAKQAANAPLWERRSVQAPLLLDVRVRASNMKRRIVAAGA